MFCKFCGKEIPDSSTFCPSCGKQLDGAQQVVQHVHIVSGQSTKNLGLGMALAFLFGPLGLLYSSVKYACILVAVCTFLGLVSCGSMMNGMHTPHNDGSGAIMFGGVLFWIVFLGSWLGSIILSWYAITQYNDNVRKGKMNRDID